VDTVFAVIDAFVRKQNLQKRNASPICRKTVADSCPPAVSHACSISVPLNTAGSTGHIVLGSVGQNSQFIIQGHFFLNRTNHSAPPLFEHLFCYKDSTYVLFLQECNPLFPVK